MAASGRKDQALAEYEVIFNAMAPDDVSAFAQLWNPLLQLRIDSQLTKPSAERSWTDVDALVELLGASPRINDAQIGPTLVHRIDNAIVNLPQIMANHHVAFAFQSNATTGVRQLPLAVQYAVFRGLTPADALDGLTESAAKMLSLESRIGSLEPGKDADLVVMSGPPFEPSSGIIAVMIDGEWVYERGAKP